MDGDEMLIIQRLMEIRVSTKFGVLIEVIVLNHAYDDSANRK